MNHTEPQIAHMADAIRKISEARHYHRYFGAPVGGLSERHNKLRADANATRVRVLSFEAGRAAFLSGGCFDDFEASLDIDEIRDSFMAGWMDTVGPLAKFVR